MVNNNICNGRKFQVSSTNNTFGIMYNKITKIIILHLTHNFVVLSFLPNVIIIIIIYCYKILYL